MIRFALLTFALALPVCHVNGFYSHRCKESETSSDKIVRFLEKFNCTLAEGQRRFEQKLNFLQEHFQKKFEFFAHQMTTNGPYGNENHDDYEKPNGEPFESPLHPMPVIPSPGYDYQMNENQKNPQSIDPSPVFDDAREGNRPNVQPLAPQPGFDDQEKENSASSMSTTALPGYEGLDHPIDIRMVFDNSHRASSRPRRDADEEGAESENQGKASSDDGLLC